VHTRRVIAEGLGVTVSDFVCCARVHPEGAEEANEQPSIVFLRRGAFRRTQRGARVLACANHVLFFHPDHPYRIAHPHVGGDECTIFTLSSKLAERRPGPFLAGHAPCGPRLAELHFEVLAQAAEPALAREDALAALLDEALGVPLPARSAPSRHRDLTEGAKAALHARLTAAPHLAELARSLGVSPFHLSRTFARVEGIPLRRYFLRLRLREAALRLTQGQTDLSALALDVGFFDHSHFTNAFRREWGVGPGTFRERTRTCKRLRSVSDTTAE
jgi:AraC-like DNA-binding protein